MTITDYAKNAFRAWTPASDWAWTRFAKAAQFKNQDEFFMPENYETRGLAGNMLNFELPFVLKSYDFRNTVAIIDLPKEESIPLGIALKRHYNLSPIPLYNAVVGTHTGTREDVVKTADISRNLAAGALALNVISKQNNEHEGLPKAKFASFLLDSNRDDKKTYGSSVYDNRWHVTEDDMPDALYLDNAGVEKVLYVASGTPHDDIVEILNSYAKAGIEVEVLQNDVFSPWNWSGVDLKPVPNKAVDNRGKTARDNSAPNADELISPVTPRIFTAIFGIIAGISILNFLGQWFGREEPFLWTVPATQWLTYAIMPEELGDVFLLLIPVFWLLLALGLTSKFSSIAKKLKTFNLIILGFILLIVDSLLFYVYAGWYGFMEFAETPSYALFAFGLPLVLSGMLAWGLTKYSKQLNSPTTPGWYSTEFDGEAEERFWNGLEWKDRYRREAADGYGESSYVSYTSHTRMRTVRRTRTFASGGYSGYGGSGRGGYSGSGFSSSYRATGG